MVRGGTVCILTNKNRTTLYTGVTADLPSRLIEHREKYYPSSFTARDSLNLLIYHESFLSIEEAIVMEKYIKGKNRKWKEELIEKSNPLWRDLGDEVMQW